LLFPFILSHAEHISINHAKIWDKKLKKLIPNTFFTQFILKYHTIAGMKRFKYQ